MNNPADLYHSPDDPNGRQAVEAIVASAPADAAALLHVLVPSFDRSQAWRLRWMPRPERLPAAGDPCLVEFTKDGTAWVAAWWPNP